MKLFGFADIFLLGSWSLRYSNDPNFQYSTFQLDIRDNQDIVLTTNEIHWLFAKTIKTYGKIQVLSNDQTFVSSNSSEEEYVYSLMGIELPFQKRQSTPLMIPSKQFHYELKDRSLIIKSTRYFYIFDLILTNTQQRWKPHIETKWDTFLFLQLLSFFINQQLMHLIHVAYLNNLNHNF